MKTNNERWENSEKIRGALREVHSEVRLEKTIGLVVSGRGEVDDNSNPSLLFWGGSGNCRPIARFEEILRRADKRHCPLAKQCPLDCLEMSCAFCGAEHALGEQNEEGKYCLLQIHIQALRSDGKERLVWPDGRPKNIQLLSCRRCAKIVEEINPRVRIEPLLPAIRKWMANS